MKPQDEEQKLAKGQSKARKPRFQIEKLEERIAPARGGTPGKPVHDHYPRGRCHYNVRGGGYDC
jgi:hypothetical protein